MFDGLKEKLGNFRKDVEETAEENAEPIDEDETEIAEGDVEDASATGIGADGAAATDVDADDATVTDVNADEPSAAADTADSESSASAVDDDDADATSDEDADTSLTRKAKTFARGKFVIEEEDLEDPLWDLEMALIESDVEMAVAEELLDNIRDELVGETRSFTTSTGSVVEDALREALLDVIDVDGLDFESYIAEAEKPVVIIFTGVNGVGKTTSIAKIARYLDERGFESVLANGDTFRAGANEQIEEHADRLGKKLIAHEQGGDPAAVIYDAVEYAEAHDADVVLGDTAGRLHTSEGLMDQLAKIERVVGPDLTVFVDEAVAGQDAVNRAREFNEAAEIDGSILTKADADSQGGAAISIAHVTGTPILFLGTGQGYDDLEAFDPEWLVDQLLGE